MKLSELRPCDLCGEKIAPHFYEIEIRQHIIDARKANQTLGLAKMLGGNMALAQAFAPADSATFEISRSAVIVCMDCMLDPEAMIAALLIAAEAQKEEDPEE